MIGHLQRNKVGGALDLFDLIQSVDSVPLARKISEHATGRTAPVPVLLQLNAGGEASKFGIAPEELERHVAEIAPLPGLEIAGIMTLAPLGAREPRLREIFGRMRALFERLRGASLPGHAPRHLSMGMSNDFGVAIEEGATFVRVGRAIFGERS
jgi:pyridoxal phosphate enzyme (YggS family)